MNLAPEWHRMIHTFWREHSDSATSFAMIAANVGVAVLPNNFVAPINWIVAGFALGCWTTRRWLGKPTPSKTVH